jgi:NADH dehydrogenase FAD-containing subunit
MSERGKVVIIGGGFGGLSAVFAAQRLHSHRVDLMRTDRQNFHLVQPLLYQVPTGSRPVAQGRSRRSAIADLSLSAVRAQAAFAVSMSRLPIQSMRHSHRGRKYKLVT